MALKPGLVRSILEVTSTATVHTVTKATMINAYIQRATKADRLCSAGVMARAAEARRVGVEFVTGASTKLASVGVTPADASSIALPSGEGTNVGIKLVMPLIVRKPLLTGKHK
jgi:hypothetical protein